MSLHQEIHFETELCEYLGAQGWLYAEGDPVQDDRTALISATVTAQIDVRPLGKKKAARSSCPAAIPASLLKFRHPRLIKRHPTKLEGARYAQ